MTSVQPLHSASSGIFNPNREPSVTLHNLCKSNDSIGAKKSTQTFLYEVFRQPFGSWTSAPKTLDVHTKKCVFLRPQQWGETFAKVMILPFVRIHSGNHSKFIFLCICICYEIKIMSKLIFKSAVQPPQNRKEQLCLHLSRKTNSKTIFVCICICYEMHN